MQDLGRIVAPIVPAFTDDTSTLSEVRVSRLVRFHKERGASGFMVGGECSDLFQLAHSERKQLLEWVVRDAQGLPVWVDVTATTSAGAVDLCQHAARHGAKGAIVCPPPIGRYFSHEAKALTSAVNRHGNLASVFADPEGVWADFDPSSIAIPLADPVDRSVALFDRPSPAEMAIGEYVSTPFAMFGAKCVAKSVEKMDVFRPAMLSVIKHGGLNRAARAAVVGLGCDIGPSRSPVFELSDEGKKILSGLSAALGV